MITVEEAIKQINAIKRNYGDEWVSIEKSVGRILAEDILADRDLPPFDRVSMDGIAVLHNSIAVSNGHWTIEKIAPAGSPQQVLENGSQCIEVMTGAVLPQNTDTVIRYEDLEIVDGIARLKDVHVRQGQNVHTQGKDTRQGSLLVSKGKTIDAATIGTLATVGKANVQVRKVPRILVVSTGDELVAITETPAAHQIRRSNVYSIQSLLRAKAFQADELHIEDDKEKVIQALSLAIEKYDVLILSGAVSKGKYDFVPEALESLGIEKQFHRVAQRPGKPFWFGVNKQVVVFALPGNPVSSFMCTVRYVLPWLHRQMIEEDIQEQYAVLEQDVHFSPDLVMYKVCKTYFNSKGQRVARPVSYNGSGDLASLSRGNAFVELPRGRDFFPKGSVLACFIFG